MVQMHAYRLNTHKQRVYQHATPLGIEFYRYMNISVHIHICMHKYKIITHIYEERKILMSLILSFSSYRAAF